MRYTVTIYDEMGTIIYQPANVWKESVLSLVSGYLELTRYQPARVAWTLTIEPYPLGEDDQGE